MSITVEGKNPWQHKLYATKFWICMGVLSIMMATLPSYFSYIQKRNHGIRLNDFVLEAIPSYDCSLYIFTCLYGLIGVVIFYCWSNSWSFFRFATAFTIVTLFRLTCILIFPLEPPANLVILDDPFISYIYGGEMIDKDLFFSGHTSTVFLIYLVFKYGGVRYFSMLIVIAVAIMLLIQHTHYTIDVLAAFPFTYLSYRLSFLIFKDPIDRKWFELRQNQESEKMFAPD